MKKNSPKTTDKGLVLILDDDKLIRYQLNLLLESAGYTTRCFASGAEFFKQTPPTEPACLLLDVNLLGGLDGPEIQTRLLRLGWMISIVFITAHATVPMAVKAIQDGALDVLAKPIERKVLFEAVEKSLEFARKLWKSSEEQSVRNDLISQLSPREQEVLTWIIAGKLNKQIASILGITERTVKAHRASVMNKLEITSVVDLVRIADKSGIRPGEE